MARRRRKTKVKPLPKEVAEHLHEDDEVTEARLRAFGDAKHSTQLLVLAELRLRRETQWVGNIVAVIALAAAGVALVISVAAGFVPMFSEPIPSPGVVFLLFGLAVFGILGFAAYFLRMWRLTWRVTEWSGFAAAWLPAFEDELARRQMQKGRAARRWRRSHGL